MNWWSPGPRRHEGRSMSFHTGNINGSNPLFISLYNDNNQNTNKVQKQNKFNIFGNKIKIGKEKLS